MSRAETVEAVRKASRATHKGRGTAKAKPKLPTERTIKLDGGFKVVVTGRKGFDEAAWAELLRAALEQVAARIDSAEGQAAA